MEIRLPLILDGATGTQLQKLGMPSGVSTEQWVIEHPETITQIQQAYVEAGSNVVYACTFGANRVKLEEYGIYNKVNEYNRRLVEISRAAVNGHAYVAGDISPTGLFMTPMGDTPFEELVEIYTEQAKALDAAGADLFVVETMMTVSDAKAAVLAIKSITRKPIFVTFTCDENGKTLTGSDVSAVLLIMQGLGVDAFGLNCSNGPDKILEIIQDLSKYATIPLIAKPNAGLPHVVNNKTVYDLSPLDFVKYTDGFLAAGVGAIGGCCGSTEDHIRALSTVASGKDYTPAGYAYADKLPAATEKHAFMLDRDVNIGPVIPCDDNFPDSLEDALSDNRPVIAVSLTDMAQVETLSDNQYAIDKPLCICTDDEAVLEAALRIYQGRALYDGAISEAVLERLARKYGVLY